MAREADLQAVRKVVSEYLEGMIYGKDDLLRSAMHPLCMQAGHFAGDYEFLQRDAFIEAIDPLPKLDPGAAFSFEIQMIDITGDVAMAKVSDACFGTVWTDYLTLIRHGDRWQIVMKAFYDHAND